MATRSLLRLVPAAAVLLLGPSPPVPGEPALEGRAPTRAELRPAVEAAFLRESYPPGTTAQLVIASKARGLRLRVFRSGPERILTRTRTTMNGIPMTARLTIGASPGRRVVSVRLGGWPSGLYFARVVAADGRVGFAPFVVRPRRLGEHRVAVVLPTLTWQAYNLRDEDGDGEGDSWYANWRTKTVRLGRPYLSRGVPYNFHRYDLPFLRWLARTKKEVDVLAQSDLEALIGVQYRANGRAPRQPWIVRKAPAASWVLAGTGLREGAAFGRGGVEIDMTTPASPGNVQVLAEIPNLFGPGRTAQMTYYETRARARVFAAGAFYLTRLLPRDVVISRLLENLWARLADD